MYNEHRHLIEFGLGKSTMKTAIQEEATEVIEKLKQKSGSDILIENNFNIAIFNILWRVAVNQRFDVSKITNSVVHLY